MSDLLSKEISLDYSDPKIITLFFIAIVIGTLFLAFFLIYIKSAFKVARVSGTSLFNIFNIVLFGLPIVLYMTIPFFTNNLLITAILAVAMWTVAALINITKTGIKYGIIISLFQIFFGFILSAVVHTIVSLIAFVITLILCYCIFGPEMFDFMVVLPDGQIVGIVKTGKNTYIDSKGRHYYYNMYNKLTDSDGNEVRIY